MRIPFGKIDQHTIGKAQGMIQGVLNSAQITEGPLVAEFESKFAEKFGWKYAVATSSGTTAGEVIWAAAMEYLFGARQDDKRRIVTPACAFVATANCLVRSGLVPTFVDINLRTLNLSVKETSWTVGNSSIQGIQFVATMGHMDGLSDLAKVAETEGIPLVADLCEGHGATFDGAQPSKFALAATYSLYPAHLVVAGEGGVICTNNDRLADLCRSIKSHGRPPSGFFNFERIGCNAKWNEIAAAIGLASLEGFDERVAKRKEIRQRIADRLADCPLISYYAGSSRERQDDAAPHAYPLVLSDAAADANRLRRHLESAGIETKTLFGSLPTQHGAFRHLGYKARRLLVAERLHTTGLHIGLGEFMSDDDVDYVVETIKDFFCSS